MNYDAGFSQVINKDCVERLIWGDMRSSKRKAFILFTSCSQIYSSSGNGVREVRRTGPLWWVLPITVGNQGHRQHHERSRGEFQQENLCIAHSEFVTLFSTFQWFLHEESARFVFNIKWSFLWLRSIAVKTYIIATIDSNGDSFI